MLRRALLCLALGPMPVLAQATSALAGTVRDSLGQPLPLVTVYTQGRDLTTTTDSAGHFFLRGIPSGRREFTIMRLGFQQMNFEATLPPDSTIVIDVRMRRVQSLAPVAVMGAAASINLARKGYFERQQLGLGKFVTPEEVERMKDRISMPSQLVRDVLGVRVRCGAAGRCSVSLSDGGCFNLFVNGVYTRNQIDDVLSPGEVYAIEVYRRQTEVPMEFLGPARSGCVAALAVWTQTFAK